MARVGLNADVAGCRRFSSVSVDKAPCDDVVGGDFALNMGNLGDVGGRSALDALWWTVLWLPLLVTFVSEEDAARESASILVVDVDAVGVDGALGE